jgi:hypothetical protein
VINIKKLKRPNKKSGFALESGETTEIRGLTIVNRNSFPVYVDKYTTKKK